MDIHAWLRNTKDRQPPEQLSPVRPDEIAQRQHRERSYDLRDILARQGLKRDRSRTRDYYFEVQQISKHAHSHEHKRRREIQGQIDGSSSDLRDVVELGPYDRKPRRKTRIDLYEPKIQVTSRKSRRADGPTRLSATKRAKAQEMAGREKKDDSKRLTLQPDARFGLYRHGRSSAQISARRSGLPDLVFNEMKFLQEPMQVEKLAEPDLDAANHNRERNQSMHDDVVSASFRKGGQNEVNHADLQQKDKVVSERQQDSPELYNIRHKRGQAQKSAEVNVDLLTRSAHARNVTSSSLSRVRSLARQVDNNHPESQQSLPSPGKKRHIRHELYHTNPRSASNTNITRYPLNTEGALSLLRARCESDALDENNNIDTAREAESTHHADLTAHKLRSGKLDAIRDQSLQYLSSHKTQYVQESPSSGEALNHSAPRSSRIERYRTSDILNVAWKDASLDNTADLRYNRYSSAVHQSSFSPKRWAERYLAHDESLEDEEEQLQSRFNAFKKGVTSIKPPELVEDARRGVELPTRGLISFETQRQSMQRNISNELQPSACRIRLWNTGQAPSLLNDSAMSVCHSRSGNYRHQSLQQDQLPHHEPLQTLPSIEASVLDDAFSQLSGSLHFSGKTHIFGGVPTIVQPLQATRPFSKPNILY